jgi:hypothetical protein
MSGKHPWKRTFRTESFDKKAGMSNAFYELKHEIGADYFTVERNHDFSFPLHMHRFFELILIQEGSMTVTVEKRDYVLCETAYYVQPKRKVAIIHNDFKLCYDKHSRKFELYDLSYDPREEHNLFYPEFYDTDRKCWYSLNQRFYYPNWQAVAGEKELLQNIFSGMWRNGTFLEELEQKILFELKQVYSRLQLEKAKQKIVNIGK